MTLPKWNAEWEKPDPLRGRRGWALHHYASIGVALILGVIVLGWAILAFAQSHKQAKELKRLREQRIDPFNVGHADPLVLP